MSNILRRYRRMERKAEKAVRIAILQTRCMAQRVIEIPVAEVSKAIAVTLMPLPGQRGDETRMFYLAGEAEIPGPEPRELALIYREGPAKEASRIVVAGSIPKVH